jgi:hypothetical protein
LGGGGIERRRRRRRRRRRSRDGSIGTLERVSQQPGICGIRNAEKKKKKTAQLSCTNRFGECVCRVLRQADEIAGVGGMASSRTAGQGKLDRGEGFLETFALHHDQLCPDDV